MELRVLKSVLYWKPLSQVCVGFRLWCARVATMVSFRLTVCTTLRDRLVKKSRLCRNVGSVMDQYSQRFSISHSALSSSRMVTFILNAKFSRMSFIGGCNKL
eukprot:163818-Amphidinium_carterae.1